MSGVAVLALIGAVVCAFAMGYTFGAAPIEKQLKAELTPQEEVSANVRLILEAERARKEAAEANLMLETMMARNAELVRENICLKSRSSWTP